MKRVIFLIYFIFTKVSPIYSLYFVLVIFDRQVELRSEYILDISDEKTQLYSLLYYLPVIVVRPEAGLESEPAVVISIILSRLSPDPAE